MTKCGHKYPRCPYCPKPVGHVSSLPGIWINHPVHGLRFAHVKCFDGWMRVDRMAAHA